MVTSDAKSWILVSLGVLVAIGIGLAFWTRAVEVEHEHRSMMEHERDLRAVEVEQKMHEYRSVIADYEAQIAAYQAQIEQLHREREVKRDKIRR